MAAHPLARTRLSAALAALAILVAPAVAAACPYCAGRAGGGVGTGIVLGSFVMLPFLVAWIVYRVIRAETRTGDASMLDVTEHVADRPLRQRTRSRDRAPVLSVLLPHRLRREAE